MAQMDSAVPAWRCDRWSHGSGRAGRHRPADQAMATIQPQAIRADMRFLSDDLLEGRRTGTRGHEIAARYMASRFEELGLEPAGDQGTYFQNVPLRASHADPAKTTMSWTVGGKRNVARLRQGFHRRGRPVASGNFRRRAGGFCGIWHHLSGAALRRLSGQSSEGKNCGLGLWCAAQFRFLDARALFLGHHQAGQCGGARGGRLCDALRSATGAHV